MRHTIKFDSVKEINENYSVVHVIYFKLVEILEILSTGTYELYIILSPAL